MSTQHGAQQPQNAIRAFMERQNLAVPAKACDGCGSVGSILHHIHHRGVFRLFCTSCVLKLNAGCFCSVCYEVFDLEREARVRIECIRCASNVHLDCVGAAAALYICPPCGDPRFVYFGAKEARSGIDLNLAKQLRAAALIANGSTKRAAAAVSEELAMWTERSRAAWRRVRHQLDKLKWLENLEFAEKNAGLVPDVRDDVIEVEDDCGGSPVKRKKVVQDNSENEVTPQGVKSFIGEIADAANGRRNSYVNPGMGKARVESSSKKPHFYANAGTEKLCSAPSSKSSFM